MRVSAITCNPMPRLAKTNVRCASPKQPEEVVENKVAFKGLMGKVLGGTLGAGVIGLITAASLATVGIAGAVVLIAAEVGGAVAGGAIGDKVTGKDED